MPPKYATQAQLNDLKKNVDETKALVFDIKDNHLKCLDDKVARLDERTRLILWLVGATFGSIVLGILATLLLKLCFNLAI